MFKIERLLNHARRLWLTTPNSIQVVRVGESHARILSITPASIEYIDMRGRRQTIDLKDCAKNWVHYHDSHAGEFILLSNASKSASDDWNEHCVGTRGALDDPPWVELMNEQNTRFEFKSYQAIYRELLSPLGQAGWHTFDTD